MEPGTSNHPSTKNWEATNLGSNSVRNRESTNPSPGCHNVSNSCRYSSRPAARRSCVLETRYLTNWLTSGAPHLSMSLCNLRSWILLLSFLLSTMQPLAYVSAVRVVDGGIQRAGRRRPSSAHRGEYSYVAPILSKRVKIARKIFLDLECIV